MNTPMWLLSNQLKRSPQYKNNGGFTLIELLVALVLAFLVITPLMGFMISILDTDRKEQAKATTEQEVQAGMDYISRDLQQAIYIYNATGIGAIADQLPSITNGNPVLVFWKREFAKDTAITTIGSGGSAVTFRDDSFVNSLVAYYLIRDNQEPWSKAARIARFQIKDGVLNKNGSTCATAYDTTSKYSQCPDPGFKPVDLSQRGQTLQQKMDAWRKDTAQSYTQNTIALLDFIDPTTTTQGAPAVNCPTGLDVVPSSPTITGFYACVNPVTTENRSVAEVYLRGNALARLTNDENKILYNSRVLAYFPTAKVRTEGRSFIFTK